MKIPFGRLIFFTMVSVSVNPVEAFLDVGVVDILGLEADMVEDGLYGIVG